MYKDERGYIITEQELQSEYNDLKQSGETDCRTFSEYIRECCGKNGTLEKISWKTCWQTQKYLLSYMRNK